MKSLFVLSGLVLAAGLSHAATMTFANPCPGVGNETLGCYQIIEIASDGSISIVSGPSNGQGPYDQTLLGGDGDDPFDNSGNKDDVLIGVQNGSSNSITSITMTGNSSSFDFTPDPGNFLVDSPCDADVPSNATGCAGNGNSPNDYVLSGDSFTCSHTDSGCTTINFGGSGVAPQGFTWFALEGPITGAGNTTPRPPEGTVPEPGTLLLLGSGLLGAGVLSRLRRKS